MPNTYKNKVVYNGTTLIDLTADTAVASDVAQGKYFHLATGERVAGTASGGNDFVITLSYNDQTEMWEPDCTYAEVNAAYQAGKEIAVVTSAGWYPASCTFEDDPHFLIVYTVSVSSVDSYGLPIVTQMSYVFDQNGITSDGDYVTIYPEFASPSVAYTPTTSQQTDTITFDPNSYNGIEQVSVTVNAMPSGTAGTPTATKGTVSNHSVSVTPSVTNTTGYITGGTKTGTAVSVSASELVSGTLSITSSGTKDVTNYASASVAAGGATASATKGTVSNHSVTVTPSVTRTAGYVTAGSSNGTAVTVSASELVSGTYTVDSSGTKDVTNYASASVAAGSATASATKGSVSNHSVSVTPSVTRTAGWVSAGTASGTAVTVSASELVSGNKAIVENGTNIDVTDYATVSVNVSGGGGDTYTLTTVVPQQTVTPNSNRQAVVTCNEAYISGESYIVTVDGVEWATDCNVLWGDNYTIGCADYYLGASADSVYPWSSIWYHGECSFAFPNTNQHTVKVERLEFVDGPLNLIAKSITANGTYTASSDNADGYSSVTVNVSGGGTPRTSADLTVSGATVTAPAGVYASDASKSVASMTLPTAASATSSGTSKSTITPGSSVQYLNIPTGYNGTASYYTISAASGSSKNVQVAQSTSRATSSTYTSVCSLTCSTAGTYDVYWDCFRSSTGGTSGSQLYIGGNAYGSANTAFTNHAQTNHLTGVSLSKNQTVAVYARSRGSNYYAYCGQLTIVQTA